MYGSLFGTTSNFRAAFAAQSRHKSFIEILSEDPNLQDRYNARGENAMLPEVPFEKFKVGSQFFVLAKRHAVLLLKDKKLWRKFKLPCLNLDSCYPEEHYFPTLLSMADPRGGGDFTGVSVQIKAVEFKLFILFCEEILAGMLAPLMDIADDVIFRDKK
ncbi:hypothetical protein GH714_002340 [Hevea brasiliensis]|uniref:Uncharacterized protein n=1 Tax=Hevea brasiliensis TaxID=3981 RepID=A0A6A6N160_HEVBR|nr:hypothetical protein GH714_002340 [Hevea brasiliensis]